MTYKHVSVSFTSLVLFSLLALWTFSEEGIFGIAFFFTLLIISVIRHRYADNAALCLIESGICLLCSAWFFWGLFGLASAVAALAQKGRFLCASLISAAGIILGYFGSRPDISVLAALGAVYLFSVLFGLTVHFWKRDGEYYKKMADTERQTRLELEKSKAELITLSKQSALLAEQEERNRIARDIHDHVGHEITGALLAVQGAEKMYSRSLGENADGGKIESVLNSASERLQLASEHLRETVHNLKSTEDGGLSALHRLTENFSFCEANFSSYGDFADIPFSYWTLLEAVLKEALTNTARHSDADRVTVRLDASGQYLRMTVTDNGTSSGKPVRRGMGLTNMRERVAAQGGSFSASNENGFILTCNLKI